MAALGALATLLPPSPEVRAQMVPATLLTSQVDTEVPPPTAVPPTTRVPAPTASATEKPKPRDQGESNPAPAPTEVGPTGGASPTRTRRPTRTPRVTATTTPTPLSAGALRLTVSSEPALLVAGQRATLVVAVQNRTASPVADVTLQVTLPPSVLVDQIDGSPGYVSRSEDLVRWYLPALEAGRSERLRLEGLVSHAPAEGVALCVLLLSGGSPAELCATIGATSGMGGATEVPSPTPTALPADAGEGRALDVGLLGLGILLLGLGTLGVALGLRRPPGGVRPHEPDGPVGDAQEAVGNAAEHPPAQT